MGTVSTRSDAYARHDPSATVLHGLVAKHLESFVRFAQERSGKALPRYVVDELRGYLRCGDLACGFGRARCAGCGHDMLVAFSCKLRGVCPSCGGRRMSETAAKVVDGVFPDVPMRQWVLSVPFELRTVLAADPAMLTLTSRVFFEELRRWYRTASGLSRGEGIEVEVGALTFVHRGGGSLNLHVHLHVLAADGVWRCPTDGATPEFVATRPPTREDLEGVVVRVAHRIAKGIERAGESLSEREDALDICRRAAQSRGTFSTLDDSTQGHTDGDEERFGRRPPKAQVAALDGFNLHASVIVGAHDRDGRERLLRYVARPMVALERVSELADGRVAWRLKNRGRSEATHRVMAPMEFMARLCALVPPPRFPLVRYHGVFAPHSPWRPVVVPISASVAKACEIASREMAVAKAPAPTAASKAVVVGADVCGTEPVASDIAPKRTRSSRIDWATLMHRVWGWDVLKCPRCEDRMRFIAVIREPEVITRILTHLGLSATATVPAPAKFWGDPDTS